MKWKSQSENLHHNIEFLIERQDTHSYIKKQNHEVREATLSVLDIFGQPVDEDEPMLMPLGGGVEEEPSSSDPRSSDPSLQSSSSDGRGGRAETLGSPGTLVHQYLKQNSQVKAHIPSF